MGGKGGGGTTTTTSGPSPEAARVAGEFQLEGIDKSTAAAKEQIELAIAELRRQEGVARADLSPGRLASFGALDQLQDLVGLARPEEGSAALADRFASDPEGFDLSSVGLTQPGENSQLEALRNSPGYQFRQEQGEQALHRSAAAKGLLGSGRTAKALQEHGQNFATNEFGAQQNRLASLAGLPAVGQSAQLANQLGGSIAGAQTSLGSTLSNAALSSGQTQASAHLAANTPPTVTRQSGGGGFSLGGLGSLLGGIGSFF